MSMFGKIEGGSPRQAETELQAKVAVTVLPKAEPKSKPKLIPAITESLPNAFRKSRRLYPKEIAYAKQIYGDSIDYDKVRVTRDHWFSKGSTRVVGNTINFTSFYAGEPLFEKTPEEALNEAGLLLLGHEIGHVWQFQNGGWAYAGDALTKQAAGYYSTGSRNTAYDWQTAIDWELPWKKWGPEQQAEAIDQWNQARHYGNNHKLMELLQPYVEKARKGEGATQFSIPGTVVSCLITSGVGYLVKGAKGAIYGTLLGVIINLPWNRWRKSRKN